MLGTDDFLQDGLIGGGPSRFAFDATSSALNHVAEDSDLIEDYDTATFLKVGQTPMPCTPTSTFGSSVTTFLALPANMGFLLLNGDEVCGEAVPGTAPPAVLGVQPNRSAHDAASTPVTISGQFFFEGTIESVLFGDAAATDLQVVDQNTILCTAPGGAPGPVDIEVHSTNGDGVLGGGFVYTPALLAPGTAPPGAAVQLSYLVDGGTMLLGLWGNPAPPFPHPLFGGEYGLNDPNVLFFLPFWPFDTVQFVANLPSDPGILGLQIGLQALGGPDLFSGLATFTNRVTLVVAESP